MRPDCTPTKTCTKCGRELPATTEHFYRHKPSRYGLHPRCKTCLDADHRAYRADDPERFKRQNRAYRERHSEQIAEYLRQWHKDHKDEQAPKHRQWKRDNRDAVAASNRNRKAVKRAAIGSHTAADVAAQRTRQHGRCYWCGEKVGRHYHVDHVVPLARGGSNGPENLVIACAACNLSKGTRLPHEFSDRLL